MWKNWGGSSSQRAYGVETSSLIYCQHSASLCHFEYISGYIKWYLPSLWFVNIELVQVDRILHHGIQGPIYPVWSIRWLRMSWWHKEPGHQQPSHWPSSLGMFPVSVPESFHKQYVRWWNDAVPHTECHPNRMWLTSYWHLKAFLSDMISVYVTQATPPTMSVDIVVIDKLHEFTHVFNP